jgi:hypothetical protein
VVPAVNAEVVNCATPLALGHGRSQVRAIVLELHRARRCPCSRGDRRGKRYALIQVDGFTDDDTAVLVAPSLS